jgi:hypothetical protein
MIETFLTIIGWALLFFVAGSIFIKFIEGGQETKKTNYNGSPHAKLILCYEEEELYVVENYVNIVKLIDGDVVFVYDYSSLESWLDRAEIIARDIMFHNDLDYIDVYLFEDDSSDGKILSRISND